MSREIMFIHKNLGTFFTLKYLDFIWMKQFHMVCYRLFIGECCRANRTAVDLLTGTVHGGQMKLYSPFIFVSGLTKITFMVWMVKMIFTNMKSNARFRTEFSLAEIT